MRVVGRIFFVFIAILGIAMSIRLAGAASGPLIDFGTYNVSNHDSFLGGAAFPFLLAGLGFVFVSVKRIVALVVTPLLLIGSVGSFTDVLPGKWIPDTTSTRGAEELANPWHTGLQYDNLATYGFLVYAGLLLVCYISRIFALHRRIDRYTTYLAREDVTAREKLIRSKPFIILTGGVIGAILSVHFYSFISTSTNNTKDLVALGSVFGPSNKDSVVLPANLGNLSEKQTGDIYEKIYNSVGVKLDLTNQVTEYGRIQKEGGDKPAWRIRFDKRTKDLNVAASPKWYDGSGVAVDVKQSAASLIETTTDSSVYYVGRTTGVSTLQLPGAQKQEVIAKYTDGYWEAVKTDIKDGTARAQITENGLYARVRVSAPITPILTDPTVVAADDSLYIAAGTYFKPWGYQNAKESVGRGYLTGKLTDTNGNTFAMEFAKDVVMLPYWYTANSGGFQIPSEAAPGVGSLEVNITDSLGHTGNVVANVIILPENWRETLPTDLNLQVSRGEDYIDVSWDAPALTPTYWTMVITETAFQSTTTLNNTCQFTGEATHGSIRIPEVSSENSILDVKLLPVYAPLNQDSAGIDNLLARVPGEFSSLSNPDPTSLPTCRS